MGLKYEPSLDGLRAVAVLFVIAYHARAPYAAGGGRGVDLFFVLSGYLITGNLAAGNLSVSTFWKRRAVRLLPALFVMTAVSLAIAPWLIPRYAGTAWRDALLALTYTMNFAQAVKPWDNIFLHTWSLAAEVQFYLIWPLILPFLLRRNPAMLLPALWLAMLGVQWAVGAHTPLTGYYFPHFSGLILGAAIPFLPAANRWLGLLGFAIILPGLESPSVPLAAVELGAALMVSSFRAPSALRSVLEWPPLVRLGLISYGVYLWHFPIHCIFEATPWFVRGGMALAGGIALGELSYRFVETRLARRLRPALA